MILCVAEKPSVGRDIARILGANVAHQGYMEGNGYWVTWTFGHLCTLKEPADYNPGWQRWSLVSLPMIPPRFGIKLIADKGVEKQFGIIRSLINDERCTEVVNCGDAGQEGELIQRWVYQLAKCKVPVKRLWISSLTDDAVRDGFKNLRPEKDLDSLYIAGLCRAIGDWLLGINATRLYTLKYRDPESAEAQVLSVGRVQTPTLALVVDRQKEIANFVPKDSWELKTLYRGTLLTAVRKPFDTEEKGQKILESLRGTTFRITDVAQKRGREAPPKLFDLTSLQVEANKKYGLTAEVTLQTAQSLYEKKLLTYPRVDTTYLTDDIYPKCGSILNSLADYQELLQEIRGKKLRKDKKFFDNSKVTDHHAIIPTGQPLPATLSPNERLVYDLVARRFISAFFPDCIFSQTTVKGTAEAEKPVEFKAGGKTIIDPGWKRVYAADANTARKDKEEEQTLPEFVVGESGPHEPRLAKKSTQPPKYYTEGTLLKAMETAGANIDDEELRESLKANGIGRPSTRASIIELLFRRGYIRREKRSIRATEAGIALIETIREELLKSARLTGMWEGRLRAIERGEYSAPEFITALRQMVYQVVGSVMSDNTPRRIQSAGSAAK